MILLVNGLPDSNSCKKFANCCMCDRCRDRHARSRLFHREGRPFAADDARRESAEYFERPWLFDNQNPPRPLSEARSA